MQGCDRVNAYVDANKPWELAKHAQHAARLHDVCSVCIEAFRLLTIYLKPVLPHVASQVESFLQIAPLQFADAQTRLGAGHSINAYKHLMQRVENQQLDALFAAPEAAAAAAQNPPPGGMPLGETIAIGDFAKIDLRIAKIVECEAVPGSSKLLCLRLDVGEGRLRTVFSGIAGAYRPQDLQGKLTVMVANLAARKMRFGTSEGMVLAASHADGAQHPGIYLLEPGSGAAPGMRVQ